MQWVCSRIISCVSSTTSLKYPLCSSINILENYRQLWLFERYLFYSKARYTNRGFVWVFLKDFLGANSDEVLCSETKVKQPKSFAHCAKRTVCLRDQGSFDKPAQFWTFWHRIDSAENHTPGNAIKRRTQSTFSRKTSTAQILFLDASHDVFFGSWNAIDFRFG